MAFDFCDESKVDETQTHSYILRLYLHNKKPLLTIILIAFKVIPIAVPG